jgi:crotonobetainyl-CoA:carnitine CoA-transferase CaiB-like acyl-CoA transferase
VPAGGRDFAGPAPLDRLYQAADGWVRLAATGAQLGRLVAAGLAPDAPAPGGPDGDADLTAGIAALIGGLPAAEVLTRASAAGIAAVRARQVPELAADEGLAAGWKCPACPRARQGTLRTRASTPRQCCAKPP